MMGGGSAGLGILDVVEILQDDGKFTDKIAQLKSMQRDIERQTTIVHDYNAKAEASKKFATSALLKSEEQVNRAYAVSEANEIKEKNLAARETELANARKAFSTDKINFEEHVREQSRIYKEHDAAIEAGFAKLEKDNAEVIALQERAKITHDKIIAVAEMKAEAIRKQADDCLFAARQTHEAHLRLVEEVKAKQAKLMSALAEAAT